MYNLSVVRRVKNGDAGAFRILFEDWAERAYARAYDILGDEEQARQAALLAFADIYGRAKELADPRGFEAWAEQIVAARACAVAAARRTLTEAQRERLWDGVAAAAGIAVEEGEGSGKKADEPLAGAAARGCRRGHRCGGRAAVGSGNARWPGGFGGDRRFVFGRSRGAHWLISL